MTTTSQAPHAGPLTGVRVVELAGMGPVAFTGMTLADLGADVVRVDRPGPARLLENDAMSSLTPENDTMIRGKGAIGIDLKSEAGLAEFRELVTRADVVLESFRPGVAERLGIGPADALEWNPGLIYARLSGYGQDGRLRDAVGHDINYLAVSGMLHVLGQPGRPPVPPTNFLADYAGGGQVAAMGILAALYESERSGKGQVVDAAMSEGANILSARIASLHTLPSWDDARPGTNQVDGGAPYYRCYEARDGRHLAVGAIEPRYYREFISRLDPDWESFPAQNDRSRWPELADRIASAFATRDMSEWTAVFEGTDACVSPVLTREEGADYLAANARPAFHQHADAVEPLPAPRFSRTPSAPGPRDLDGAQIIKDWEPRTHAAR